jgi:multicomponent Na+:H+ antiporter subunit D
MALTGVIAVGALLVSSGSLRLALLEVSALLAVALVARNSSSKRATWAFLAMVLVSALSLVAGQLLLQRGDTEWARALLIGGFFLKLAVVPLFLWLPSLAEKLPALVMGVVISVLDIAAFGELYSVAQSHPWVITPVGLWVGVGMASALLASTLMLVESNLKRLLAFSTIEDIGFLTLGVASANEIGMRGALIAATVHALAKALLFISLSAPEADGALSAKSRGLASRYPLSAAGFLLGMLAMLGIPPTLGFAGRWRLYETALQINPWVLAVFVLSSMFALISYVLCLTRVWWGPPIESDVEGAAHVEFRKEPMLLCATIVVIMMLLLVGGLWPDAIAIVIRGIR